ncbi:MAG: hypothetical protein R3E32_28635 [Chitinophagales bacterium]
MNTINFFSNSKKTFTLLFLLAVTTFFHSCVKEEDYITKDTIVLPSAKEMITTSIFGLVVDENDAPVINSEVLLKTDNGFEATTTDENGNFKYFDVRVVREGAFLKVREAGKFEGFRKMNVTPNSYNYTKIKLLDKTIVGTVSSTTGGTVSHSSNAQLKLSANSVRYQNGGEYTGNVNVAMSWIDPTASDLPERMVGDLSGVDNVGEEVYLGTYGMLNVELLADNGDELQLKDGSPATLSFPVPASIRSQAPSTIPLWSYNEDLGTWLEEGSATLQGGFYVGDVAHFSSWNCDYKGERISLTGKVVSRNSMGQDVETPFLQIYVTVEGILTRGGYLDNSGEFEFYNFPANEVFTLTIKDRCDNIIFEQEFGPFASDTDLGTIIVQATSDNFITITGTALDCDDNAIADGYVQFELDNFNMIYPLESDGTFEIVVNVCDETTGDINVIDIANEKASMPMALDLTNNPINAGILKACEELPSFLDIDLDGADFILFFDVRANITSQGGNDFLAISSEQSDTTSQKYYFANINVGNVTGVGTYTNVSGYFGIETQDEFYQFESGTMEITEFGLNTGDIIRGTFEAEVTGIQNGVTVLVPATGTFKAIRQ